MSRKEPIVAVKSSNAPAAIGPYSQAIKVNGFVFVSGQSPLDPVTQQLVRGGLEEQTRQVFKNLEAVLKEAGSGLDQVIRCGVFLKDLSEFENMNRVYSSYFGETKPARTTIEAARLPKDCLIEIDAIALASR